MIPKSYTAQVRDVLWGGGTEEEKLDKLLQLSSEIEESAQTPEVKAMATIVMHLREKLPQPALKVAEDVAA